MNAPPLLVSFPDVEQYLAALPEGLPEGQKDRLAALAEAGLPPVESVRALSVLFGVSSFFVGALRKYPERYYRTFRIPKGNGFRVINAPKVALKVFQKWFAEHLTSKVQVTENVFGFVPGRSAFDAAAVHCGAKWVYSVDIESFFPSVRKTQVFQALLGIGYSEHAAELIADLSCYRGCLAQGSPASPVLSNLVFLETDEKFRQIALKIGIRYSRYADDVVFSGEGEFPKVLPKIVRLLIESRGWKLAKGKEKLSEAPRRLKVHGLLVHRDLPRLTKGYRNRLRAYKHLSGRGLIAEKDVQIVNGHLAFGRSVDLRREERARRFD